MVSHPSRALALVALFIVAALVSSAAIVIKGGGADPPPPPVNTEFAGVLIRVGLSADTLAAAGVTSTQVSGLASAVRTQHNPVTLRGLDGAHTQAKATRDRLSRLVRSGLGTPADVSALAQAETDFTNAQNARQGYLDGLRAAGLATLASAQAAIVQTSTANRSWELPPQYLVKSRSQANWVALREALATKRISEQDAGEGFPLSAQTYLAAVDLEPEIAAAKVLLDTNIASVQTAWNAAATD